MDPNLVFPFLDMFLKQLLIKLYLNFEGPITLLHVGIFCYWLFVTYKPEALKKKSKGSKQGEEFVGSE